MPELSVKPASPSFPCSKPPTATRRQDVANELQQNVTNLGFVAFCPKESRARMPELSVQQASPLPPGGRMPPISTSGSVRTLASSASAQGKADTMSAFSVKLANPRPAGPDVSAGVEAAVT